MHLSLPEPDVKHIQLIIKIFYMMHLCLFLFYGILTHENRLIKEHQDISAYFTYIAGNDFIWALTHLFWASKILETGCLQACTVKS